MLISVFDSINGLCMYQAFARDGTEAIRNGERNGNEVYVLLCVNL